MDSLIVKLINDNLDIQFVSEKNKLNYKLFLEREGRLFPIDLVHFKNLEDHDSYHFSVSLQSFLNNLEEEFPLDDTEIEINSFKFNIKIQYLDNYTDDNDEQHSEYIIQNLKINKKMDWHIENFKQIPSATKRFFVIPYVTKKNAIALLVNKELSLTHYFKRKVISKIRAKEDSLMIKGKLTTKFFSIKSCTLQIIERGGDKTINFPVKFSSKNEDDNFSLIKKHDYSCVIKTADMVSYLETLEKSEELSLDLFFLLELNNTGAPIKVRVGNPRFLTNYFMNGELASYSKSLEKWHSLTPYFTLKGTNLSFTYNLYDKEAYDFFREHKNNWNPIRNIAKNRDIWIIGERSYKAQDNGYHFFKFLRTEHPEVEAYYVIKKDSPERKNVEKFGNIIDFNSKEHFEKVIQAKYICGTHHPDSLYPIRSKEYIKNIRAKKIFLQHGVFGTKNIAPIYAKSVNEFHTDLFITSSQKERQIAISDLGYSPDEVVSTGLSRFESLFKEDIPLKRQLLIIPTWRDWITNNEIFEKSEYFQRYISLLFNPKLAEFSEKFDMEIIFVLHPNMQDYVGYFEDAPVTILKQGDRDVQDLIKESMLMLTDYSSVAFDFSFLHKPVIYYQFDRNRFLGKFPSHLDLDAELPGYITDNEDKIIEELFRVAKNRFVMDTKYVKRADNFIQQRDENSNRRIYKAIRDLKNKSRVKEFFENDTLVLKLEHRFRRSRLYFPTMKFLYTIFRTILPVDENRVLFESSLGKRYEDSPRAIYEAMVANNEKYEFIWVSNTNEPLKVDPNTKIIKRLSFDYYKYLATSKYWVNNQNFPTYIKKRKATKYLQTWHGTPIKKMQHDQNEVLGRDDGYLKRVSQAKDQWSALISPSPYASKAFRSAFQYQGEIIEKGYPRNDIFYHTDVKQINDFVRNKLNIPLDKKVILYAPTFRDNQKKNGKFVLKNKINFRIFERRLGKDYVLLVREHVVVASKLKIPQEFRENIIDVSKYPSIQDLMIASDILVTDYSSVMFDYLNTNKPIYFYCYDINEYNDMRGFYFDLEAEAPGPIVKNSSTLFRSILNSDSYWLKYGEKYQKFREKFIPFDGPDTANKVYKLFFRDNGQ